MSKHAYLLMNTGTPQNPTPEAVGKYLKQFLMDPYIIDLPWPLRWFLVHVLIVPKRKFESAHAYQSIWTPKGSPLLVYSEELTQKVQSRMGENTLIKTCMAYGEPSPRTVLNELKEEGIRRVTLLPMFPQFSTATTSSVVEALEKEVQIFRSQFQHEFEFSWIRPFYQDEAYLEALTASTKESLSKVHYDHILFSFHGLPESYVKKADPSGSHCLMAKECCKKITEVNQNCYRAQCYATVEELKKRLGLSGENESVSFQSRLGRQEWIKPYTEERLVELAKSGVKNLAVVCPAFVTDCLETLEEIQIRAKETFVEAGGGELYLIPCLNQEDRWADAVCDILRRHSESASTH